MSEAISQIAHTDRQNFLEEIKQEGGLIAHLSEAALRFPFIPPRLFELVSDPNKLRLEVLRRHDWYLCMAVIDWGTLDYGLTDMEQIWRMDPELPLVFDDETERRLNEVTGDLRPRITHYISIVDNYPGLEVYQYRDIEELRGQGVATSFYHRLQEVLGGLGYRYFGGHIASQRARNFFEKLGRVPSSKIRAGYKETISESLMGMQGLDWESEEDFMVSFLDPKEKIAAVLMDEDSGTGIFR